MADGDISLVFTIAIEEIEKPDLADVGALLNARTKDTNGHYLGTFTSDTRPTGAQVSDLIDLAVGDLRARVGPAIPADRADQARHLIAIQAATLIEASYFPEQLDSDRSAYPQYTSMYLSGVQSLAAQIIAYVG